MRPVVAFVPFVAVHSEEVLGAAGKPVPTDQLIQAPHHDLQLVQEPGIRVFNKQEYQDPPVGVSIYSPKKL